jgi:hypothetical protein
MANNPSDHSAAELSPGSAAPAQQGPLAPASLDAPGVLNPDSNFPPPLPGLPAADISAPIRRPQDLIQGQPPLGRGWGVDNVLNLAAARQLPHDFANAGGQVAAGQQSNLVPLVAFPVLSRLGPQAVSWAVPVAIVGLSTINARASYHDLKITPGIRGIQLSYGATNAPVYVKCNITGMSYTFPQGPNTVFAPLFMLREFLDLTISCANAFPAGSTCLLTTEEQLPWTVDDGVNSQPEGTDNLATAQISVLNSATLIAAARAGRAAITILNTGAVAVSIGNTAVTVGGGMIIPPGASLTLNTSAAIYGISATTGQLVSVVETF